MSECEGKFVVDQESGCSVVDQETGCFVVCGSLCTNALLPHSRGLVLNEDFSNYDPSRYLLETLDNGIPGHDFYVEDGQLKINHHDFQIDLLSANVRPGVSGQLAQTQEITITDLVFENVPTMSQFNYSALGLSLWFPSPFVPDSNGASVDPTAFIVKRGSDPLSFRFSGDNNSFPVTLPVRLATKRRLVNIGSSGGDLRSLRFEFSHFVNGILIDSFEAFFPWTVPASGDTPNASYFCPSVSSIWVDSSIFPAEDRVVTWTVDDWHVFYTST